MFAHTSNQLLTSSKIQALGLKLLQAAPQLLLLLLLLHACAQNSAAVPHA
jgi:hypothetical protein